VLKSPPPPSPAPPSPRPPSPQPPSPAPPTSYQGKPAGDKKGYKPDLLFKPEADPNLLLPIDKPTLDQILDNKPDLLPGLLGKGETVEGAKSEEKGGKKEGGSSGSSSSTSKDTKEKDKNTGDTSSNNKGVKEESSTTSKPLLLGGTAGSKDKVGQAAIISLVWYEHSSYAAPVLLCSMPVHRDSATVATCTGTPVTCMHTGMSEVLVVLRCCIPRARTPLSSISLLSHTLLQHPCHLTGVKQGPGHQQQAGSGWLAGGQA
jgi:hypothetical protein